MVGVGVLPGFRLVRFALAAVPGNMEEIVEMKTLISHLLPSRKHHWFLNLAAIVLAAGIIVGPSHAFALSGPEQYAGKVGNQAIVTARAGGSKTHLTNGFKKMLRRYSSIRAVAPQLLGPYRRKLPAKKKREYQRLVEEYTARLFANYYKQFAGQKMQIKGSRKRGARHTVVTTQVLYAGNVKSSPIEWMITGRNGGYRIVDISVYGVWLSVHMRSEFKKVLRNSKGDFNALFSFLRK